MEKNKHIIKKKDFEIDEMKLAIEEYQKNFKNMKTENKRL